MNRTFAYAKVYGEKKALAEAQKLKLSGNSYYHELLGYLYSKTNIAKAVEHYQEAVRLSKSITERQTLTKRIKQLLSLLE